MQAGLRTVQDKNFPLQQRAELARSVLYGRHSQTISVADMRLDEVSPETLKAQSQQAPLESWWDGGKAPILVLQGLDDVLATPENGRSLQRDHPDRVTLVEFPDLGHRLSQERPDLTANAIVAWARKFVQ
jgi:pimeloyl-ACP methyl ester carboxylesterase